MLFWRDPHQVLKSQILNTCISEKLSQCRSPEYRDRGRMIFQKSIHDEGHSRRAYMMRVFPEKHA
jgi:hypothetical protein